MSKTYLVPGKRTPFVKAGGAYAAHDSIAVSRPVVAMMADEARPDMVLWGQVIPSTSVSNVARELLLEAGLDPEIPGATSVLACSTSMLATIHASGMVAGSKGDMHLALVGGVETMSHVPIALHPPIAQKIAMLAMADPQAAIGMVGSLTADDVALPIKGWANRISGRSMGDHTEDTAKRFKIERADQDAIAYTSHTRAIAAQAAGFFDDLIVPFAGVAVDDIPRADTSLEKLGSLKPVFDRSGDGTLTAGNSSPLTDGAAGLWVANEQGLARLDNPTMAAELVDWRLAAMDYTEEGILMAPARAIPRLLASHGLTFEDIGLWEIHEAFAAQVLANIHGMTDPDYRKANAGVEAELGAFPKERLNPNGGSLAIGHPFGATGARILSQAAKELSELASGTLAVVSICADGGQGSVALLRKP